MALNRAFDLPTTPTLDGTEVFTVDSSNFIKAKSITFSNLIATIAGFVFTLTGATTARSLKERFSHEVNVKDYGCSGLGTSDESTQVQNASNALTTGSTLIFPRGDYKFKNVTLPSDCNIVGLPGSRLVGISPLATTNYFFLITGTSGAHKSNVQIRDIVADGAASMTGLCGFTYVDRATVWNCKATNFGVTALIMGPVIGFTNCTFVKVDKCHAADGQVGVLVQGCTNAIVTSCYLANCLRDGILFYNLCSNVKAIGNTVENYATGGEQGRAGIHFYGGNNGVSQGNFVKTAFTNGAFADSTNGAIRFRDFQDFTSTGDTVEAGHIGILCNQVGDFAGKVTAGVISGARVSSCNYSGINIAGSVGHVIVSDCLVQNANLLASASVASINISAPKANVRGCTVIENATSWGINLAAANCRADGNIIVRCGNGGSSVPGIAAFSTNCGIANNTFIDDRGTPTSTLAIRIYTACSAVIGDQVYSTGISTKVFNQGTHLTALSIVSKNVSYTVLSQDNTVTVDTSSGNRTMTLPAAATVPGKVYIFKKTSSDANQMIIDGAGSETIDGALTVTKTAQYDTVRIQSDGTNWLAV